MIFSFIFLTWGWNFKMYTVSKGPSKIVAKTRRGNNNDLPFYLNVRCGIAVFSWHTVVSFRIFSFAGLSQNLERLDSRKEQNRKSSESDNGEVIKYVIVRVEQTNCRSYQRFRQCFYITWKCSVYLSLITEQVFKLFKTSKNMNYWHIIQLPHICKTHFSYLIFQYAQTSISFKW